MTTDAAREATKALLQADAFLEQRKLVLAEAAYNQAEKLGADPDHCAGGRWKIFMLRGDMKLAHSESDVIRSRGSRDEHRFWNGRDLSNKTVILRCLHGYGDTIQMLRYLPLLLTRAERVIVEVQPKLLSLARVWDLLRLDRLKTITWGEKLFSMERSWDVQIEVMELPYIFETSVEDLPIYQDYLRLPPALIDDVASIMDCRKTYRAGLVWTAGEWDPSRTFPVFLCRGLVQHPVEFWSLVEKEHWSSLENMTVDEQVRDGNIAGAGILCLASVICNLDLVVTTDTLVAHLAGSIGIPVWLMLPRAADWRWMHLRTASPWYPSIHIFRQPTTGDWSGVLRSIDRVMQSMLEYSY